MKLADVRKKITQGLESALVYSQKNLLHIGKYIFDFVEIFDYLNKNIENFTLIDNHLFLLQLLLQKR